MKTIVCFGTSITQGVPHVHEQDTFPALLGRRLNMRHAPCEEIRCINSGVSGENTAEGLARIEPDVLAHHPDLVIVEFGINDIRYEPEKTISPEEFAANLRSIHAQVVEAGAGVVFTTLNPIINAFHAYSMDTDYYDRWGGCNGAVIEYAGIVREVAYELETALCDVYQTFVDRAIEIEFEGGCADYRDLTCLAPYISTADGVHPTAPGQALIASALYKVIVGKALLNTET